MIPAYLIGSPRASLSNVKAIAHGNSLVANFEASDAAHGFVLLAATALGIAISNQGVGSQFITTDPLNPGVRTPGNNMMYTAPTAVDPLLDPTKLNVLFGLEDINTGIGGFTGAQMALAWKTYRDQRKAAAVAAGAKLHFCLLLSPPAWIGIHPNETDQASINAMNANMVACHALIRANPRLYCDSYIDLPAITQFTLINYLPGTFDASGVYFTDRVHPINPGHALIANAIVATQATWRRIPAG